MSDERHPKKSFGQFMVLQVIRLVRRFFYNTPVHRSHLVNILYERIFHMFFKQPLVQVSFENLTFKIPSREITILPSLLNGCYETYEIELLKGILSPGMTFVDVGANIGLFTVIGSRLVGEYGNVWAFEPESENFRLLTENLCLNGSTNVHAQMLAVGNRRESVVLHLEKNSIGTHSLLRRHGSDGEQVPVDAVTLDDWFVDIPGEVDLMKIDVEGYEPFVLEGCQGLLRRTRYVLFEYNRLDVVTNNGIRHLLDQLRGFPYLYGIRERGRSLVPFSEHEFFNTNYINILASKSAVQVQ